MLTFLTNVEIFGGGAPGMVLPILLQHRCATRSYMVSGVPETCTTKLDRTFYTHTHAPSKSRTDNSTGSVSLSPTVPAQQLLRSFQLQPPPQQTLFLPAGPSAPSVGATDTFSKFLPPSSPLPPPAPKLLPSNSAPPSLLTPCACANC